MLAKAATLVLNLIKGSTLMDRVNGQLFFSTIPSPPNILTTSHIQQPRHPPHQTEDWLQQVVYPFLQGRYRLLLPLADTRDNIIAVDLCREPLVDAVDPLDTGGGYILYY